MVELLSLSVLREFTSFLKKYAGNQKYSHVTPLVATFELTRNL